MKPSTIATSAGSESSLLKQYKLICAVIDAPWATRLDNKIARHVIDRYYAKFGNARASLRYLEQATGATRANIIGSLRRITNNGVINVIRQGIGTRPTEYDLNFDFAPKTPSGIIDNTSTSGIVGNTSSGIVGSTSSASSGIVGNTKTYLRNLPTGRLTVSINEVTPAVPTAPPVSGLEADTAASAVDPKTPPSPFEELWAVYPRKHQRAKARAAYKALAPDAELHANLVAAASAWANHYERNATEKKWWKHLHTWLAEERYLEDLPEPYENPKEAAIAGARENGPRKASKSPPAGKDTGLSPKTPIGSHKVKVIDSEMPDDSVNPELRMIFRYRIEDGDHQGKEFSHTFKIVSNDEELQSEGQSFFAGLRIATGVSDPTTRPIFTICRCGPSLAKWGELSTRHCRTAASTLASLHSVLAGQSLHSVQSCKHGPQPLTNAARCDGKPAVAVPPPMRWRWPGATSGATASNTHQRLL